MQKQQRHRGISFACIVFLSFVFSSSSAIRIKTVKFNAADGLEITADEYIVESGKPYVLLFHEQGSSRGEYNTIARRLCKLDYNCLAVDLRNGGNDNFVSNQTARQLREKKFEAGLKDIEQDVLAAIRYAHEKSKQPVVLFGSGANGSLSLKTALSDSSVRAVIALSPGEYFMPEIKIQEAISPLKKPVFITSSKAEFPYVSELASGIEKEYITLFEPKQGAGDRGTRSFSVDYEYNSEYWFALMLFFKDLM
ncbi:MAG: dienelactone hydrolase family protein [Bacteroidota bacterium]|nr:dienelactone hydrolase family protein [Bacteroidota bacterium]